MIDLHLHFEGSIAEDDLAYLAKRSGIELPKDFPDCLYANKKEDFSKVYDFPLSVLNSKKNIEYAAYSVVNNLYRLGYLYVELRITPVMLTREDLTQKDVINAYLKGIYRGLDENKGIDVNTIICCKKEYDFDINKETIELAVDYHRDNKVVAIDFAGMSESFVLGKYERLLKLCKDNGLGLVYHANKDVSGKEIAMAIEYGFTRFSGGFNIDLNNETAAYLSQKCISFEICPTANIQTGNVATYETSPITNFLYKGVSFSVNSDNLTISRTNVLKEFIHLNRHNRFNKNEIQIAFNNAIHSAFIDVKQKGALLTEMNADMDWFYNKIK